VTSQDFASFLYTQNWWEGSLTLCC